MPRDRLRAGTPAPYRRHRGAYRRGDHGWLLAHSPGTLEALGPDGALGRWGAGVVLRYGAALARHQHLVAAGDELAAGLGSAPGSLAERDLAPLSQWALMLVEVWLLGGRFDRAGRLADTLWQGQHSAGVRLGAARALAATHRQRGDIAGAHQWLDLAAGSISAGAGSLNRSLVLADRTMVVAADGRSSEAATMAFAVVEHLDSHRNPLARDHAAVTAATVSLTAAHHGDLWSSGQLLQCAATRHRLSHRPVTQALVDLATSANLRLSGDVTGAARPAELAARAAGGAGAEPLRAVAIREQALVAAAVGQTRSALAMATHAQTLFSGHAMALEHARTQALIEQLGAGRSPAPSFGTGENGVDDGPGDAPGGGGPAD